MELKFECPTCGQHLSARSEQIGLTAACPNCNSSVTVPARPDDDQAVFVLPTKLPFLKSHRKKILEAKVSELVSLGPIDEPIEAKLQDFAVALGLEKADATAVLTGRFTAEFEPIKRRMESSFVLTDSDLEEIEILKKKYNVNLTLKGNASLFHAIYLLESKHQLPPGSYSRCFFRGKGGMLLYNSDNLASVPSSNARLFGHFYQFADRS